MCSDRQIALWMIVSVWACSGTGSNTPPDAGPTTDAGASGTACAAAAGACKGVGDCAPGQGHLGTEDCGQGASIVCCFPESACGGTETVDCCTATATFRPVCHGGTLECSSGQTQAPKGQCQAAATCSSAGGSCKGVGACAPGQGHLGTEDCGQGASIVCCFPESACGGTETIDCCTATATFRPVCHGGTLECSSGQTQAPKGQCQAAATCSSAGGSCKSVGACGPGQGHLGTEDCGQGAITVCCFPESSCGGTETIDCCTATATFRPVCHGGTLECSAGQTQAPKGHCP